MEDGARIRVPLGHAEGMGQGCSWDWRPWVCGGNICLTSGCTTECWLQWWKELGVWTCEYYNDSGDVGV